MAVGSFKVYSLHWNIDKCMFLTKLTPQLNQTKTFYNTLGLWGSNYTATGHMDEEVVVLAAMWKTRSTVR